MPIGISFSAWKSGSHQGKVNKGGYLPVYFVPLPHNEKLITQNTLKPWQRN